MLKEKKTLITRTRFERIIVRRRGLTPGRLTCAACGERSAMLTLENAAVLCGIGVSAMLELLEDGKIHFAESPLGLLLICVRSLEAAVANLAAE